MPIPNLLRPSRLALAGSLLAVAASAAQALTFQLSFTPGTTAQEQASFVAAANLWSAQFTDAVTVKLTVGTAALGSGILGQAGSRELAYSYTSIRGALSGDASSAADAIAMANLPLGSTFGMLINRTANNPNGSGSATAYVDNNGDLNNQTIRLTASNARALGLSFGVGGVAGGCVDCDAFIQFSTAFSWDHDRSNGIGSGAYDFIGIAAHEIGHALGFISGIDELDYYAQAVNGGPYSDSSFDNVTPLDLFRWSAASRLQGVIDWTASTTDKYFSIDGGLTVGPSFATGLVYGDGRQASHWKDNLGIGLLDPTAGQGELLAISANDLKALDVVGWNLAAVPEPRSAMLFVAGLAAMGWIVRRRRRAQP